ncbi:hypothetical protein ACPZ19_43830, partial [Amycolatopsis lurida]
DNPPLMSLKLAAAVVATLALLTSCSSPPRLTPDQILAEIHRESGGREHPVTAWPLTISRKNGEIDSKTLYVVVRPDGSKVMFDWTGQRYEADLEDFRANNRVLTDTDKIFIDNTFPDASQREPGTHVQLMMVTGHTSTIWTWWLITGMAVLMAAAVAGIALRIRSRRRVAFAAAHDTERVEGQDHGEPTRDS